MNSTITLVGIPEVWVGFTKWNREETENEEFLHGEFKKQVGEEDDREEYALSPR
jgi:hypothetical protein